MNLPTKVVKKNYPSDMETPKIGISVDAMASGNPGPARYQGVDLANGKKLFLVDIGISTNNIAEYLAVCHGVLYCVDKGISTTIYTDSQTALSWVKSGYPNTSLTFCDKTAKGLDLMKRARDKMNALVVKSIGIDIGISTGITVPPTITVSKWYKNYWGEPPADFGEKIIHGKSKY